MHIATHFTTFGRTYAAWAASEMDSIYRCYEATALRRWETFRDAMVEQGAVEYAAWLETTHMTDDWRGWYYCATGVEGQVVNSNAVESFHSWLKKTDFIDTDRVTPGHFHYITINQLCR